MAWAAPNKTTNIVSAGTAAVNIAVDLAYVSIAELRNDDDEIFDGKAESVSTECPIVVHPAPRHGAGQRGLRPMNPRGLRQWKVSSRNARGIPLQKLGRSISVGVSVYPGDETDECRT